ncbi:MAG: hypothetical protein IJH34_17490 [Romboutsia sp.]|uniref:S41 family peptidase n=1 Tax=Clostridium sp. DSM 8431 TaxID=1761781 RepID=UPI0008EEF7A8|nr:S41 family peptidase [Clostridium sp. DSM 8431]MBQ3423403.1 hypothetical protein [Romboutsia sp.]SFU52970.1 C-terminal processing protease CtpA/Prc, contains a PDZ domain [Clostridium sp. DSM 8431]
MKYLNLYNEVKNIISDNYIFLDNQKYIWINRVKCLEENLNDFKDEYSLIEELLLTLKDPHTKYVKLNKDNEVYDIDCTWVEESLIIMPNIFRYKNNIVGGKILAVNDIDIDDIIKTVEEKLKGFPKSVIKEEVIKYIKTGLNTEVIYVKVNKNDNIKIEEIKRISIDEIKKNFTKELKEIQYNSKPIFVKEIENNILLIKIFSFRIQGLLEYILNKSDLIKKNKVLIFDIRNNRGGFIKETKRIVSSIIEKDVELDYKILSNEGLNNKNEKIEEEHNAIFSDKDIYIVCDEYTMSSAEFIFLSGLKKGYKNLKVIGNCTAGVSGQAKLFLLSSGDILQVTIKKYLDKKNREINKGYTPDIIVKLDTEDYVNNNDKVIETIKLMYEL